MHLHVNPSQYSVYVQERNIVTSLFSQTDIVFYNYRSGVLFYINNYISSAKIVRTSKPTCIRIQSDVKIVSWFIKCIIQVIFHEILNKCIMYEKCLMENNKLSKHLTLYSPRMT